MSMHLNQCIPSFLYRLDSMLLKSKPALWSSRFHYVIFLSSIICFLLFGLLFFVNIEPREPSTQLTWILLICIIIILSVVTYLIFLLRFNVFKRFGEWDAKDSLLSFLLYFLSFMIIYFWAFIPSLTEYSVAHLKYNLKELIQDQNNFNVALAVAEKDSLLQSVLLNDTVIWMPSQTRTFPNTSLNDYPQYNQQYAELPAFTKEPNVVPENGKSTVIYLDSFAYSNAKAAADSARVLSDSSFEEYIVPNYFFLGQNNMMYNNSLPITDGNVSDSFMLTKKQLYYSVLQSMNYQTKTSAIQTLNFIKNKYLMKSDLRDSEVLSYELYVRKNALAEGVIPYSEYLYHKYYITEIDNRMSHIRSRLNQWNTKNADLKLHILFYLSLVSSLILFMFRHTTTRSFFLTFLVLGLLVLFSSLFVILTHAGTIAVQRLLLFYYLFFILFGLSVFWSKTQRLFLGIALNIGVLGTYFLPMFILSLWYSAQQVNNLTPEERLLIMTKFQIYMRFSEYIGFVFLLICIYFMWSRLYKKWIALPEF